MQRRAMVIGIKPECIEDYKKYHADPWPEVLECISKGNVKNFSIFIHGTILFGYFEYHMFYNLSVQCHTCHTYYHFRPI